MTTVDVVMFWVGFWVMYAATYYGMAWIFGGEDQPPIWKRWRTDSSRDSG